MNTATQQPAMNENRPVIPVCVSAPSQASALILRNWTGERWVLPWAYLVRSNLTGPDHRARLELVFTGHRVTVTGENLHVLLDDLAAHRIGTLRDLPEQFRPPPDKGRPFIAQIEVCVTENDHNPRSIPNKPSPVLSDEAAIV